jgi:hypothetical protein
MAEGLYKHPGSVLETGFEHQMDLGFERSLMASAATIPPALRFQPSILLMIERCAV